MDAHEEAEIKEKGFGIAVKIMDLCAGNTSDVVLAALMASVFLLAKQAKQHTNGAEHINAIVKTMVSTAEKIAP